MLACSREFPRQPYFTAARATALDEVVETVIVSISQCYVPGGRILSLAGGRETGDSVTPLQWLVRLVAPQL